MPIAYMPLRDGDASPSTTLTAVPWHGGGWVTPSRPSFGDTVPGFPHMIISHHRPGDAPALSHLLDLCFGPGRHLRTASLLRARSAPVPALSFAAHDGVKLIGSVQCWPVRLVHDGGETALTLLGPLAVHPNARGRGLAHRLMHTALWAAERQGAWPMVLIGDPTFYAPMGFDAARTGAWVLPGPVERHRLLTRGGDDLPLHASLLPLATDSLRRAA